MPSQRYTDVECTVSIGYNAIAIKIVADLYAVMLDNTVATMGDLIGFEGFLNSSAPFSTKEYKVLYKDPTRQYLDFKFSNKYNDTCAYPRLWLQTGFPAGKDVTDQLLGCYDSEFDQVRFPKVPPLYSRGVTDFHDIVWRD